MYHTLAHPSTIELTERNVPIKTLARELCHKFNLFVMSHDVETMKQIKGTLEDPIRQIKYEDRHLRLMLTKENGTPFCTIRASESEDKSGKSAINYVVTSNMISKHKGRGNDRKSRESINIKALMKSLQKDYDIYSYAISLDNFLKEQLQPDYGIYRAARDICKVGWNDSVTVDSELSVDIFKFIFESTPFSEKTMDKLKGKYDDYLRVMRKREAAQEMADRFRTECYMVVRNKMCPAVVAKISIARDKEKEITEYKVHDEVKCYSSMDALSADLPDLAVSIKMFNTKNDVRNKSGEDSHMFPIALDLPEGENKLDVDLDMFIESGDVHTYGKFGDYTAIIVPVAPNA